MSIIAIKNICKTYRSWTVLNELSLSVDAGELVGIVGRTGSGKTTLLNLIGLLASPDSGEYLFDGNLINYKNEKQCTTLRRDSIGFVVQDYALIKERNVFYNIALPLASKKVAKREMKSKVVEVADRLNISSLISKYPHEISGGESQRVAIARALIKNPMILLADEPTGALDETTESEVLDIFKGLNKTGVTILLVTHNQVVSNICTSVYELSDGTLRRQ